MVWEFVNLFDTKASKRARNRTLSGFIAALQECHAKRMKPAPVAQKRDMLRQSTLSYAKYFS